MTKMLLHSSSLLQSRIFHHQLKDKSVWSYAAGHIDKEVSVQDFIEKHIIHNAEVILRGWGFQGEEYRTFENI